MSPLKFDDIKNLFENEYNVARLANDVDSQRRAENCLDSLKSISDWPEVKADFVRNVNEYRRSLDAISYYLVYATRIKRASDPMLDVLIAAGRRQQTSVINAFINEVDDDERVEYARAISRILSKDVGSFIADAERKESF